MQQSLEKSSNTESLAKRQQNKQTIMNETNEKQAAKTAIYIQFYNQDFEFSHESTNDDYVVRATNETATSVKPFIVQLNKRTYQKHCYGTHWQCFQHN